MTTVVADSPKTSSRAEWLLVFDAAMRVGNFPSMDDLLNRDR